MATMTQSATAVSIDRLRGNDVRNMNGDKVGSIQDLAIDMKTGCLDFAVISFGGVLGVGTEYHIVPKQLLQIEAESHTMYVEITKDQLEYAPGFSRSNVPDYGDTNYVESVFAYWGVQRGTSGGVGSPQRGESRATMEQRPGAYSSGQSAQSGYGQTRREMVYGGPERRTGVFGDRRQSQDVSGYPGSERRATTPDRRMGTRSGT